jgi:hypothetical protein
MQAIYSEDNDIHYAYSCIHQFFDVFGIQYAIQYTESALRAATSRKIWNREDPSGLLFYMEKLELLCTAVFAIYYSRALLPEAILPEPEDGEPDMLISEHFHDRYFNSSTWINFPRNLTARQYYNPYKAIKKFCKYMASPEWKAFCKELTENALAQCPDEMYDAYDILTIRMHLLRMIEACHLVLVRTGDKKKAAVIEEPSNENMQEN